MGTISDKLLYLQGTKSAIKDAIVAKGVSVGTGTPFRDYATKIGEISGGGTGSETADEWVRPTEWLPLPDNVDGVQKVSILNAVFDTDSEFVAFVCRGAYTVDWGDGTVENFADNTKAEHKYDYNNANLNSNTVSKFGYKQCVITITTQAGNNLAVINLNTYHSTIGTNASYSLTTGFLDIRINSLYCTNLIIGSSSNYVIHSMLEQCLIGELAVTTFTNLFYNCFVLQSVTIKDTSNVSHFKMMHCNNYALQKMPLYTFRSAGVDVNNMFYCCYSLIETYPIVIQSLINDTASSYVFFNCKSLKYINLSINSSINYSLSGLFSGCTSLEEIELTLTGNGKITALYSTFQSTRIKESPVMDTVMCTIFENTFYGCDRLTKLQTYNYYSATTLSQMLRNCYSLKSVPNFNINSSCINLQSLCHDCVSLEKAPTFDDSSRVTNIQNMFNGCRSITTIPSYVFGTVTGSNCNSVFSGTISLNVLPLISIGTAYTSNSSIVNNCFSLKRMLIPLKYTFTVANAKMSASALNEMFSILPTVTGQTVTVTGNYGASTCDTTIATAKGWTVTN